MDQATEESLVFAADSIPNSRILQILTSYRPAITILSASEPIIRGLPSITSLLRTAPRWLKAFSLRSNFPGELNTLITRKAEATPFC